jgi:LuxR family maltose regulon positive regulatory protein
MASIKTSWLSLDEGDNDPVRFLSYVIAALQTALPEVGQTAIALLQSPQPPTPEAVLTLVINELAAVPAPIILVLDDYHAISTPAIHQAVTFLLEHQPPNLHLVITSRADPLLPLARWRARREVADLRAADLRFTVEEAAVFLNESMGLALTAADVAALETRTEGWIAGLQLAGLALQGHRQRPAGGDTSKFIQAFTGSHRYIVSYLVEEVLNQRPQGSMNFLLQTSVLDPLSGPLCDYVLRESSVAHSDSGGSAFNSQFSTLDSQAILEKLEQANLFIVPLDEEGKWYRYHHLFAEVLRARLQKTQPDLVRALHVRASEWYEQAGLIAEAVRHALEAEAWEPAAWLIERAAESMLRQGSSVSLVRWLDAMPVETVHAHPRLCLTRAWTFLWGPTPRIEQVDKWVQRALQGRPANESLDSDLTSEVAVLQATAAAIRWDIARSLELSQQALAYLPLDSPWRSVMALCLGTAHFYSGDMAAATNVLNEALRLSEADGSHYIQLIAASFLADIQVIQGHLGLATELYQQVLVWADHGVPQRGAIMALSGLADILCKRNDLDGALAHLESGSEQLQQVGGAWVALALYRCLAQVQQAQGKWTDALSALDRASQSGQNAQVSLVVTQVAALRARVQLAQGNLAAAEAWAANSGLNVHDAEISHPGLREEEYLSLARVLNAQGRRAEGLSLLERLLQAAEAEGRMGSAIAILILQGLISQRQGNTARALRLLERALILAEPEGYARPFLDEGSPMRQLLYDIWSQHKHQSHCDDGLLAYVEMLMAAFQAEGSRNQWQRAEGRAPAADVALGEPVNQREREILSLIGQGFSNREIADRLSIAQSTVKWYINTLYSKLGAKSRTHALVRARELGLL